MSTPARRRRERRKGGAFIDDRAWEAVLSLYGGKCAYCLTAKATTRDLVIPLAKGGAHAIENLVPACQPCNGKKADIEPVTQHRPYASGEYLPRRVATLGELLQSKARDRR